MEFVWSGTCLCVCLRKEKVKEFAALLAVSYEWWAQESLWLILQYQLFFFKEDGKKKMLE